MALPRFSSTTTAEIATLAIRRGLDQDRPQRGLPNLCLDDPPSPVATP